MPLHYDDEVKITKINMGPYNNNGYIVVCPDTNEGVIIEYFHRKLMYILGTVMIPALQTLKNNMKYLGLSLIPPICTVMFPG